MAYTSSYNDDQGHGKHVAGVLGARNNNVGVKGVAYESRLYEVKAFDQKGSGYLSAMFEGVDWSISSDMDIVNMSAGSQTDSAAFQAVVNKVYAAGLILVAAEGNDGAPAGLTDTVDFPALSSGYRSRCSGHLIRKKEGPILLENRSFLLVRLTRMRLRATHNFRQPIKKDRFKIESIFFHSNFASSRSIKRLRPVIHWVQRYRYSSAPTPTQMPMVNKRSDPV